MRSSDPREDHVFGYNAATEQAGYDAAEELMSEEGMEWSAAVQVVSQEIDGAGEGLTVESMATCRDLRGRPVAGLTTDDSLERRTDKFVNSEKARRVLAELGLDEGGDFLFAYDSREVFLKDYAKKLVQACLLMGLQGDLVLTKESLNDPAFPWEELRNRVRARLTKKK